jgi:hypothetical protein
VEEAFESRLSELAAPERAAPESEQSLPVVDTPVAQRVVPDDGAGLTAAKHSEGNSANGGRQKRPFGRGTAPLPQP